MTSRVPDIEDARLSADIDKSHAQYAIESNMAAILRADAMAEWWKSIVLFSVILKSLLIPA